MSEAVRSSDEVLSLLKQALQKRRLYLRRRLEEIDEQERSYKEQRQEEGKSNRGRSSYDFRSSRALRGGMLSEISTITGIISGIESGDIHPDDLYNPEDDPSDK